MAYLGSPPPRIVIGSPVASGNRAPTLVFPLLLFFAPYGPGSGQPGHQAAGRSTTPSGTSPIVTRRHSATSNLRASATIIVVLRAPLVASVRSRYHWASALSFWKMRKRQAS